MPKKKPTRRRPDEDPGLVWVKMKLPEASNRLLRAVALMRGTTPAEVVRELVDEHLRPKYSDD